MDEPTRRSKYFQRYSYTTPNGDQAGGLTTELSDVTTASLLEAIAKTKGVEAPKIPLGVAEAQQNPGGKGKWQTEDDGNTTTLISGQMAPLNSSFNRPTMGMVIPRQHGAGAQAPIPPKSTHSFQSLINTGPTLSLLGSSSASQGSSNISLLDRMMAIQQQSVQFHSHLQQNPTAAKPFGAPNPASGVSVNSILDNMLGKKEADRATGKSVVNQRAANNVGVNSMGKSPHENQSQKPQEFQMFGDIEKPIGFAPKKKKFTGKSQCLDDKAAKEESETGVSKGSELDFQALLMQHVNEEAPQKEKSVGILIENIATWDSKRARKRKKSKASKKANVATANTQGNASATPTTESKKPRQASQRTTTMASQVPHPQQQKHQQAAATFPTLPGLSAVSAGGVNFGSPSQMPQKGTATPVIVCKYFKSGSCGKGSLCPFSHNLKLEPCHFFYNRGHCLKGDACQFSHTIDVNKVVANNTANSSNY
ncbi:hypothetical protein H4219_005684 [Mycoemilia scoparia]|uniref:C3H1-type domain-containing protein n=1 Tax=Mycoemilia scoparia TaxID=417184 RepID=A0A9W7ZTL6_9FUNG|nr:hypothetical protein H4219_005684 [Mycoemilia scoparia]